MAGPVASGVIDLVLLRANFSMGFAIEFCKGCSIEAGGGEGTHSNRNFPVTLNSHRLIPNPNVHPSASIPRNADHYADFDADPWVRHHYTSANQTGATFYEHRERDPDARRHLLLRLR